MWLGTVVHSAGSSDEHRGDMFTNHVGRHSWGSALGCAAVESCCTSREAGIRAGCGSVMNPNAVEHDPDDISVRVYGYIVSVAVQFITGAGHER